MLRLRLFLRLLLVLVNGFHRLLRLLALGPGPGLNLVRALVNLSLHRLFPVPVLLQRLLVLPLVLALIRVNLRPPFLLFLVPAVPPVLRLQPPLYLPRLPRAMLIPGLLEAALRLKLEHVRTGLRLLLFFHTGLRLRALAASRALFRGRHQLRNGMRGIRRRPLVHLHLESLALIISDAPLDTPLESLRLRLLRAGSSAVFVFGRARSGLLRGRLLLEHLGFESFECLNILWKLDRTESNCIEPTCFCYYLQILLSPHPPNFDAAT